MELCCGAESSKKIFLFLNSQDMPRRKHCNNSRRFSSMRSNTSKRSPQFQQKDEQGAKPRNTSIGAWPTRFQNSFTSHTRRRRKERIEFNFNWKWRRHSKAKKTAAQAESGKQEKRVMCRSERKQWRVFRSLLKDASTLARASRPIKWGKVRSINGCMRDFAL